MAQQRNKADFEYIGIKMSTEGLDLVKTAKAIGFKLDGSKDVKFWLPLSQIKDHVDDENRKMVYFAIPRWLFVENQLEAFHDEDYIDVDAL